MRHEESGTSVWVSSLVFQRARPPHAVWAVPGTRLSPPSFRVGSGGPLGGPLGSCLLSTVPDWSVHLERSSSSSPSPPAASLGPVQAGTRG